MLPSCITHTSYLAESDRVQYTAWTATTRSFCSCAAAILLEISKINIRVEEMRTISDSFHKAWRFPSIRYGHFTYIVFLLLAVSYRRFVIGKDSMHLRSMTLDPSTDVRSLADADDPYKCKALMNDGQWYQNHTWLTPGCVTEPLGSRSVEGCLAKRRVVFAGDSQIQATYWAMVQKLDRDVRPDLSQDRGLHFSKNDVMIEFLWDPYLNGSELYQAVAAYRDGAEDAQMLTVLGIGTRYAEHIGVDNWIGRVNDIASVASATRSQSGAGFNSLSKLDGPGNLLLVAPVQEQYRDAAASLSQLPSRRINNHLRTLADDKIIDVLWSFDKMTAGRRDKYIDDGQNVQWDVLQKRVDLLLSLRCNAEVAQRGNFPNTRTCCAKWTGPNWIQSGFLILGLGILPALVFMDYLYPILSEDSRTIIRALSAFSAVISLQYITDRTHVFEQVQRLPLFLPNLSGMIVFAFLIGFVTVRRSTQPKASQGTEDINHPFLPRDQSDEWKGWLQVLIIVYHYNMAWTADWYWEIIRLAVASYLFLTGFGHTLYFLQKEDYSFRRVCAVTIRTNLLPCTLAYVMRTRWLLYYYMPLSTVWFLIIHATMAIASKHNGFKPFVLGKLVASAALVHTFISTRDLPETVVRFFAITCKMSFDTREFFHHRVQIDQYIVYVGMAVAVAYIWLREVLDSDGRRDVMAVYFRRHFRRLKLVAIALALVGLPSFIYMVHSHIHSQSEWTARQPYITFVPILAFLVLRNAHPTLRNFHSVAFAWLGRYSGEMYVMQDHLWLSGDQEAVLRSGLFHGDETVPYDRWRDLLLITPLYLIACSVVGDATSTITTFFIKPSISIEARPIRHLTPVNEVEMSLLSNMETGDEAVVDEKPLPRLNILVRVRQWLWPTNIRDRAMLVLALMWGLNMVGCYNSHIEKVKWY